MMASPRNASDNIPDMDQIEEDIADRMGGNVESWLTWSNITGKPSTFPPDAHTHAYADLTGKPSTFAPSAHTHAWSDITGAPATYAPSAHTHPWSDLTSVPSTFAPSAHSHAWTDITGKPSTFPPDTHTHAWSDITSKPSTFTPSTHSHAISDVTGLQAALDAKPSAGNTLINTATVGETGLTLLALSVRRVNVSVTGVTTGKNYAVFPVNALPAGFGIVDAICTTNGTLTFGMIVPIITGSYSISVRVVQINT